MKSILTTCLIVLSLILCGFNLMQWYREARLAGKLDALNKELYTARVALQDTQGALKRTQEDTLRIDGLRRDLEAQFKTNLTQIRILENSNQWLRSSIEGNEKAVEAYKTVVEKANDNLQKQNNIIREQNDKMLEVAKQRDEFVERFNKMVTEYNSLAGDYKKLQTTYEDLVARWNAAQTQGGDKKQQGSN
jgi:chromosome segregation ATPase